MLRSDVSMMMGFQVWKKFCHFQAIRALWRDANIQFCEVL
jgi:hypothetical protein